MVNNRIWLKKYASPVKGLLFFTTLFLAIEAIANVATVWLQQTIIDDVLLQGQTDLLWNTIILITLAFMTQAIMFTLGPHFIHLSVAAITEHVSKDFIRYMYQIPTRTLQQNRTGKYVHHIFFDAEQIAVLLGNDYPRIIMEVLTLCMVFYLIGRNSLVILLVSVIIIIAYVLLGKRLAERVKAANKEVQATKSDLIVHLEEGIASTREVIAFNRLKWERAIYDRIFARYFNAVMNEAKVMNKQLIGSEPLKWIVIIFILAYGGYLVLQGNMTLGAFVIIFQFSNQLVNSFQKLFLLSMGLVDKMACVDRVRSVIDEPTWDDGQLSLKTPIEQLELKRVSFRYDLAEAENVLKEIDLSIPLKQKVAFVGSSGGGKSTIAQLLIRLFRPVAGEIIANGVHLESLKRKDWTEKVAIVFQDPYMFPDTIRNNILMGLEVDDEYLHQICAIAQIDEYIEALPKAYDTIIGERGVTLSGGQRQRLAIARALVRNPEILILDEATSSLDLLTEKKLQEAVDDFRQDKTTIVIAHRLSTIENANCIFVLDNGSIVESGTHQALMEKDSVYKQLVASEKKEAVI